MNQPTARDCPPGCATVHTSAFGPDEHVQRFGTVAARLDDVDGGHPATIAVELVHPENGPPTITLVSGADDEIDDMVRHLSGADQALALAAKLTAAAKAWQEATA